MCIIQQLQPNGYERVTCPSCAHTPWNLPFSAHENGILSHLSHCTGLDRSWCGNRSINLRKPRLAEEVEQLSWRNALSLLPNPFYASVDQCKQWVVLRTLRKAFRSRYCELRRFFEQHDLSLRRCLKSRNVGKMLENAVLVFHDINSDKAPKTLQEVVLFIMLAFAMVDTRRQRGCVELFEPSREDFGTWRSCLTDKADLEIFDNIVQNFWTLGVAPAVNAKYSSQNISGINNQQGDIFGSASKPPFSTLSQDWDAFGQADESAKTNRLTEVLNNSLGDGEFDMGIFSDFNELGERNAGSFHPDSQNAFDCHTGPHHSSTTFCTKNYLSQPLDAHHAPHLSGEAGYDWDSIPGDTVPLWGLCFWLTMTAIYTKISEFLECKYSWTYAD